jgi:glycosyltransferase involved in cell wall biosynthesis
MEHCKVFVLSSIYEGLPTVLIEALASGCPVVSTDCPGGAREILADGKYGELVPPGDAAAMARAMLKILDGTRKQVDPDWLAQFRTEHVLDQNVRMLETLSRPN